MRGGGGIIVIGNGSGAVSKTKTKSSNELMAIGTKTDHSMSDAQAIYTHFEKAHNKGETSQ